MSYLRALLVYFERNKYIQKYKLSGNFCLRCTAALVGGKRAYLGGAILRLTSDCCRLLLTVKLTLRNNPHGCSPTEFLLYLAYFWSTAI